MLMLAYDHAAGDNNALDSSALPTDPTGGYSHRYLDGLGFTVNEVRFYCETSNLGGRKIHFKTTNADVRNVALTGNLQTPSNQITWWTDPGETTSYADASSLSPAGLPFGTDNVDRRNDGGFTEFPFFRGSAYHWGIRGRGNRWECNDYALNPNFDTLHQVWIR